MTTIPAGGLNLNALFQQIQTGNADAVDGAVGDNSVGQGNGGNGQTLPDVGGGGSTYGNGRMLFAGYQGKGGVDETRLQKALAEIRDVSSSGVDLLARVMLEQQGMQRHEAVQDRTNMRAMARGALMEAAGELNKQADDMQAAAVTQLVVACVSAAVTIAATFASSALSTAGAQSEQKMASEGIKAASKLTTIGSGIGAAAQSAGKMGEAMGGFAGTEGQIAVKQSEAAQKIDEANAQQYEGQADLKKDMQTAFDDNMKQIIEFVKELKDAVADLQSAITRHA